MNAENANETESSAMVASGDGKKREGEEGRETDIAPLESPSNPAEAADAQKPLGGDDGKKEKAVGHGVMLLEDALSLVGKLEQIAITGAPSVIPNKDVADFLSRKLARSIAYHPDVRNPAYIRELVDNGFSKRNAQKIVWTARKLSKSISVDAELIQAAPVKAAPGKAAATGMSVRANADQPETPRHQRGHSLWRHYNAMFDGYERFKFKRPQTPADADGLYHESHEEINRYGQVWAAVGFRMVPEDLPKVLPELKTSGLLEVYRVDPAVIQELEETREKMLAAGVDMRLTAPSANSDQVADVPI